MAITYTWAEADSTTLKYVDDSTTPDTEKFVPVADGNRHYAEYLTWVSDGNTAIAYVDPRYADLATAKATAISSAKAVLTSFVTETYSYQYVRAIADSTYTLPSATQTIFDNAYALCDQFETAVNAETDVTKLQNSTIDYAADSYSIP